MTSDCKDFPLKREKCGTHEHQYGDKRPRQLFPRWDTLANADTGDSQTSRGAGGSGVSDLLERMEVSGFCTNRQKQMLQRYSASSSQVCTEMRRCRSRLFTYFKRWYFLYPSKRSKDLLVDMLEKFQGKMADSTPLILQMSAITSLWHFLECLSAAFIVTNVKMIKGQWSKKF